MINWVLIAVVAVIAGFAQSIAGFGAGMILMTVLPAIVGLVQAPGLTTVICLTLSVTLLIKYRKTIIYNHAIAFSAAYIVASFIVISFIKNIELHYLTILFGVFLIVLSVRKLFGKKSLTIIPSISVAVLFGFIGGICSGFFAMGGPLWALYFMALTKRRDEYMGSTQACIVVTGLTETIIRFANGIFTADCIPLAIVGILFINIGKLIGINFTEKLDNRKVGILIYSFVGICGIITIVKELL